MENLNPTKEQLGCHKLALQSCIDSCVESIEFYRRFEARAIKRKVEYIKELDAINEQLDKLSEKPLKDQVKDIHNAHVNNLEK